MADKTQNFKNHARLLPPFHFFVVPVLAINFVRTVLELSRAPSWGMLWAAVVALALVMLALLARTQALTVQNRLIRLEMRLRLRELLPADLHARIGELTYKQLIAMRFASDPELVELTRDVLAGKLATAKEIKMRVRSWQADWLRV